MKNPRRLIGERISTLRKAKNLTQYEFAEKVGLDGQHISRLETGKYYPSMDTLVIMADVLGVELLEFFLFPHTETENDMRAALSRLAQEAPMPVLRDILSFARLQLAQRQP